MTFGAIPTIYGGVQFRSRTEARWANFFDDLHVAWQYEPAGYEFDGVRYLPDFWLPDVLSRGEPGGVFFEVKGMHPDHSEIAKAVGLAYGTRRPVVVAAGGPSPPHLESLTEIVRDGDKVWDDDGVMFARTRCGLTDIGFHGGSVNHCLCGCGEIDACDPALTAARIAWPNYQRWEAAA
jgi:hypothetical protein